jgi:adenylylsulfate kinase
MIVWLIGLSGAGKTTVGRALHDRLKPSRAGLVFLDGDILREVWGENVGHTIEGRRLNAHRISHLCRLLDQQGIDVIAAVLSMFPDWQAWNRDNFAQYFEVFLDVPMTTLRARDSKGLYAAAERGDLKNVVGVDLEFPRPANSDLVIDGDKVTRSPDEIAAMITSHLPDGQVSG